jgi:hypothetical protein
MTETPTPARSLRIRFEDVVRRMQAREPILFLDVRSQKALASTTLRIPGSVRVHPVLLRIDPTWDPRHLVVIYCT